MSRTINGMYIRMWNDHPGKDRLTKTQWVDVANVLGLSSREREVCELLFFGHTRDEIAESLEIKLRTVRQYMEQIHTKLRVKNRVEVVLRIIQVRDYLGSNDGSE